MKSSLLQSDLCITSQGSESIKQFYPDTKLMNHDNNQNDKILIKMQYKVLSNVRGNKQKSNWT